jgi:hypothetical protein
MQMLYALLLGTSFLANLEMAFAGGGAFATVATHPGAGILLNNGISIKSFLLE